MERSDLNYFTHDIGGKTYGAWYRELSAHEIEVIGAGLLMRTSYSGFDALSVARSVLESSVLLERAMGPPSHH